MRFVSKSNNLLIVLRAGLQAQPLTGTPARPTLSVRFKDGIADVPEGEVCDLMLKHPAMGGDFICADEGHDPYSSSRQSSEPPHLMTEIKFGSPVGRKIVGDSKSVLPPEMMSAVREMAAAMAKEMLPSMVESTLKGLLASRGDVAPVAGTTGKVATGKKQRGRPGKKSKSPVYEAPVQREEQVPDQIVPDVDSLNQQVDPRAQQSVS